MGIELWNLFLIAITYLGVLFLIAYSADAGWLPARLVDHPIVYALSLGVYATSWTFYGGVGLAERSGFAFLTIYLGVTAAFLLGPYLLRPVLTLCRDYQLASIADLLAFRYGGRATGSVVTVFMLFGILPYISLQIYAVTESIQVLTRQVPPDLLALFFCMVVTVFAVLFGARHLTPREKHKGLVTAIAFESAVKLIALLVAGGFAVTHVFGGWNAMQDWVASNPEHLNDLYAKTDTTLWSSLLLLSFSAAFLLPRQYHMTFVENERPESLKTAYWLFPFYLLLLNLPIIPILFAGKHLSLNTPADFYVLGMTLTLGNSWLSVLVFLGGLSAATAMMIVTTLALSYMCLNHLFLPASISVSRPESNFYGRILWSKRIIIAAIIASGYLFYLVIELNQGLAGLGLISFVAAAQLLPGVLGLLFWNRGTQVGFLAGLTGGAVVWFALLIVPLLLGNAEPESMNKLMHSLGFGDVDVWSVSSFCSLAVNAILYIVGSLLTQRTSTEIEAANICTGRYSQTPTLVATLGSPAEYVSHLERLLGARAADIEVSKALEETHVSFDDKRPTSLMRLQDRLERNLSGLLGPTVARLALRSSGPLDKPAEIALAESLRYTEQRLEQSREQMQGMTKELDDLRRYLRSVLRELPLGVCTIDPNGDVLIWNDALQTISGIDENKACSGRLDDLPEPWCQLLTEFSESSDNHRFRQQIDLHRERATFNFHKADVAYPALSDQSSFGQVILVEDRTSLDTLETELAHSERLASIGRLSAGVAHEIGNPLTGIASIAQNLDYERDSDAVSESAEDILDQVDRINGIVKSLLAFSRSDVSLGSDRNTIDLRDCIHEAIRLVRLDEQAKNFEFIETIDRPLPVNVNVQQLLQVFVNLVKNACYASPQMQPITLQGEIVDQQVVVRVIDRGTGIDAEDQAHIFEPFFTTKPVGDGTGLGLPLVYSILTQHGGKISVNTDHSDGTCFEVSLPLSTEALDTSVKASSQALARHSIFNSQS